MSDSRSVQVPPIVRPQPAWRGLAIVFAAALVATGCASTPDVPEQSGAQVEERSVGAVTKPTPKDALPQKPVGQPDIGSRPIAAEPPGGGNLPAVLRDPKSLLSKRSIYFDYDSNALRDEYRPIVQAHARFLLDNPRLRVTLQGNTDERGSREYNLALGQRRADAVRQAMSVLGVSDKQMEPVSFGEERPRVPGSTEAAYAENRRADIVYDGEDKPPVGK